MTFTQAELKAAEATTANTAEAPRSCGYIVKGGKRWLLFPHANGNLYAVRERTAREAAQFWARLGGLPVGYTLVANSQMISDCNGNIYADFIDSDGFKHELCIADYNDYINEIDGGMSR